MSGTSIKLPSSSFELEQFRTFHLVNSDEDTVKMGGNSKNVYSTNDATACYNAANALAQSIGGIVAIKVYETFYNPPVITLTSDWNSNVVLTGFSPGVSKIAAIDAQNTSGNGFNVNVTAENITIDNILTISSSGNSGNLTLRISNCNITTIDARKISTSGNGGSVNITQVINGYNRSSYIETIATGSTISGQAGTVTIDAPLLRIGNITTSIVTNTGGAISAICNYIGSISCTSGNTATALTHTVSARRIGSITIASTRTAGTTGTLNLEDSLVTGTINITSTNAAYFLRIKNCTLKSSSTFTASNITIQADNTTFGTQTATGLITNAGNNSKFTNCTFYQSGTGFCINGLGTGIVFTACKFGDAINAVILENGTQVTVICIGCYFPSTFAGTSGNVCVISEREFVATFTTTNNTLNQPALGIAIPVNQRYRMVANVSASNGTDTMMGIKANIAKSNGIASSSKVSAIDENIMNVISDTSLIGCDFNLVATNGGVGVTVTGLTGLTINWTISLKINSSF